MPTRVLAEVNRLPVGEVGWRLRLEFKAQDCWVGVYWAGGPCGSFRGVSLRQTECWICLLPCLPLHLTVTPLRQSQASRRTGEEAMNCGWPEAVSDGLTLPCDDCGERPKLDYRVTDDFWALYGRSLGVVCLPCLDKRCSGAGLASALLEVQWLGTGHTVVLRPSLILEYATSNTRAGRFPAVLTPDTNGGTR